MALVAGRSFRYKQSAPTATLFRLSLQNFRNTVRGNVLGVRGVGFGLSVSRVTVRYPGR
jgi:hypothetical protein